MMQNSPFTKSGNCTGFVFSVDAVIAVLLVASAVFFLGISAQNPGQLSSFSLSEKANSAFTALENNGYITRTLDTNSTSQALQLIEQKLSALLPSGTGLSLRLRQLDLNANSCRALRTFDGCFSQIADLNSANSIPQSKQVIHSSKYFMLRQRPIDCNLGYAQLSQQEGIVKIAENQLRLLFAGESIHNNYPSELFFQAQGSDLNVIFNVDVQPSTSISCDQNVSITLSASLPENVRRPIDVLIVLDRSGSMSWNGRADTTDGAAVWANGNNLFLADGSAGLRSIDVSNPLLPSLLDSDDFGTATDVYGVGNTVFVTDTSGTDQLFSYDVSDPDSISQLDSISYDAVYGVFADGSHAYLAADGAGGGESRGLYIVDASVPSNLSSPGKVNLSSASDVYVVGNTAFVARGGAGITSVNITNKNNPSAYSTLDPGGTSNGIFVSGNYAYIAAGSSGLIIMNISNPSSMSVAGTYNTPDNALNVYVENNVAYVADNTSLQVIDVTNPGSPSLLRSFATPYGYTDVWFSNGYAFLPIGSYGVVSIDTVAGPRINNAKVAAKNFADFNGWSLPPDQMGVASYSDSATLNRQLTTNKADINAAIDSLVANGSTNTASGIDIATTELTSIRANPNAIKFQVLLSDGQSNTGDSAAAAQTAANNNIVIYTIAFGADADVDELQTIADLTDGTAYIATDQNALQAIYNLIAKQIQLTANDSNVFVPISGASVLVDANSGILLDGNLIFDAGSITPETPWSSTYILNFPCTNQLACGIDALTFPGTGSFFTYVDINGIQHSIDFNASKTLDFLKRDLTVNIFGGQVVNPNEIILDVNVSNVADLNTNATSLTFRFNDLDGPELYSTEIPQLCGSDDSSCNSSAFKIFSPVDLNIEGLIYAIVDENSTLRECPAGNYDVVNCSGSPKTQFYVIDYYVWRV